MNVMYNNKLCLILYYTYVLLAENLSTINTFLLICQRQHFLTNLNNCVRHYSNNPLNPRGFNNTFLYTAILIMAWGCQKLREMFAGYYWKIYICPIIGSRNIITMSKFIKYNSVHNKRFFFSKYTIVYICTNYKKTLK